MKEKYSISSFLVVEKTDHTSSPRIGGNNTKKITGILTARDINCFQFDDQIASDFMTPLDKLVYYEV